MSTELEDVLEENRQEREAPPVEATCPPQINRTLLPNKLFYFVNSSGYGSVQPYLTLFFKQLWLSASSAGILFGVMHLCRFAFGWMLSAIADKYHKRKLFLFLGVIASSVTFLLVSFAPVIKPVCVKPVLNSTIQDNSHQYSLRGNFSELRAIGGTSSNSLTFVYLLIVIIVGCSISSATDPLSDTLTLQALEGDSNKIGFQRAGGGLGYGLSAFLIGAFLALQTAMVSCESGTDLDYKPAMYFGSALYLMAAIAVFLMKEKTDAVSHDGKNDKLWTHIKKSMNYKIVAVMLIGVYCGAAKSIIDSFLFWRLKEIGGRQILNSFIKALQSIAEFIGFLNAEFLIKRFGHFGMMYIALTLYAIQFLIYVLIQNPWLVFLSEWMPAFTFAVFFTSGISYVGLCPGAAATMQAFYSNGFLGLGFGIGPIIGGPLIGYYGIVGVFAGCSIVTICVLILFVIVTQMNFGEDKKETEKFNYKQIIDQE